MDTFVACGVQLPIIPLNAADNLSAGTANLIASTGFIGTAGGVNNAATVLNFTAISTINVGALATAEFSGPATIPAFFNLSPVATNVFYNGISVTPQSAALQSAVQGAVSGAIASVGDIAESSFGTDSVGEQIANG